MADEEPQALQLVPGDVVALRLMTTVTEEVTGLIVDERGMIHVPLAGDVAVVGMSLTDAEARVEEALRRYDRVVRVSLVITEALGHRATVLGAVTTPGMVAVTPGTRLADLLALAGGPLRSEDDSGLDMVLADLGGARLVRNGQVLPVSLVRASEGDPRHNIHVRPGDQLYVPPATDQRIRVLGEIGSATMITYRPGIRLSEALAVAGGITESGDPGDVRIVRGPLSAPRVYDADILDLVRGRNGAHDVELAPGDIIWVSRSGLASVQMTLEAISPLLSAVTTAGVTTAVILSDHYTE